MIGWFFFPSKYVFLCLWWLTMSGSVTPAAPAPETSEVPAPEVTEAYARLVASDQSIQLPSKADDSGIATRYGSPGDKFAQQGTACKPHNKINEIDHVCAHRWYPCGTLLIVENTKTKDRNWCVVLDRGPYGANVFAADGSKVMAGSKAAWYIKIKDDDPPPAEFCPDGGCTGKWRGILDMSPAVSKGMNHPGWGHIKFWRLKRVVDLQKYLKRKQEKPLI